MKTLFLVGLTLFSLSLSYSQIQVGIWTAKSSYVYGDTIAITVTAYNPGTDTVVLNFPSTCQVSYTIDRLNLKDSLACAAIVTSVTVLPKSTFQWNSLKYPPANTGWPHLTLGVHAITGEVLGYGRSDTLIIFVTPTASVPSLTTPSNSFSLSQNYPNPFNGQTIIPFDLLEAGSVRLALYNILGQPLKTLLDGYRHAGSYALPVQLEGLPSGTYWCRLQVGGRSQTIKIILAK